MNDYFNLLNEYQELQSNIDNEKKEVGIIKQYIELFKISISTLQKYSNENYALKNTFLNSFIIIINELIQDLNKCNLFENDITFPLQKINEDQIMTQIFTSFNEIKSELFEGKQRLNKAKNEYFDFLKGYKQLENKETNDDYNLLYDAQKQNYSILYKYELGKMNEKIDKNNKKYNEIMFELDNINIYRENIYKDFLMNFADFLKNTGNKLSKCEKKLREKAQLVVSQSTKVNERFPKEQIENEVNQISQKDKNQHKLDNNKSKNMDINNTNVNKEIEINNNELNNHENKVNSNKEKNSSAFDFEILEEPITIEVNKLMDEIIKKLTGENEITSSEITKLIDNFKYNYKKYSLFFFSKVKQYYKHRVVSLKNKNNFIHLSNIINDLSIKINENDIFNEIIEISQMIKYEDLFLSSLIQKKNRFFGSKTFWINLIEDNFVTQLNQYCAKILKIDIKTLIKESKPIKENKKFVGSQEENSNYLYNRVQGIKKLNKKQKSQLEEYGKSLIIKVLSKSISNMCYFLVPEKCIMEIISEYNLKFSLGIEAYYYLNNLLGIKFKKQHLKAGNYQEEKDKYGYNLTSIELVILNAAKFIPKKNYIDIFKLNKNINLKIRPNLLRYQLTRQNITIEERIKILEIFLNIKEIKKNYNYSAIKKNYLENIENKEKEYGLNPTKIKSLSVIDLDLVRTPLFRTDDKSRRIATIIIKSITTLKDSLDYYQGMNFILLFLYQLLGFDEEKTFYFFLALEKNTKYADLFKNDLSILSVYYKVFEKILEINLPEVYYTLLDKQIMTQFYATSWFITLFTSELKNFEKIKTPKFILLVFESFIFGGWSGVFNAGLALLYYNKDKILNFNGNDLMRYMIADLNKINDMSEENCEKLQKFFFTNLERINETFIRRMIDVIKFEELNKKDIKNA